MSRYDDDDRREAAAIFAARDDPMLSKAASASSARSGRVRAMRTKTDKALLVGGADIEPITAADGASRSSRSKGGSRCDRSGQACRPLPSRQPDQRRQAARPTKKWSAGDGRAKRQALARISGASCRSSDTTILSGRLTPSSAAPLTAQTSPGSLHGSVDDIRLTARAASLPPILASASSATVCSAIRCSLPNPWKRRQSASDAAIAPASRRRSASAVRLRQSLSEAYGMAAISASS